MSKVVEHPDQPFRSVISLVCCGLWVVRWDTDVVARRGAALHAGVVMCVRWSNDGRYLASGSDDKIVMIWSLEQ